MSMIGQGGRVPGIVRPSSSVPSERRWLVLSHWMRLGNPQFLFLIKQTPKLSLYSLPLRDEDWELTERVKNPTTDNSVLQTTGERSNTPSAPTTAAAALPRSPGCLPPRLQGHRSAAALRRGLKATPPHRNET